jgi:hypothetical protein
MAGGSEASTQRKDNMMSNLLDQEAFWAYVEGAAKRAGLIVPERSFLIHCYEGVCATL